MGAPSFRSFIAEGWDSTNLDRPFSDLAVLSPGVPLLGLGKPQPSPLPLAQDYAPVAHNEDRETHERTRRSVEVASAFPGSICQVCPRSVPLPTPLPPPGARSFIPGILVSIYASTVYESAPLTDW